MAKSLVNHYKINRAANTISVEDRIKPHRLLLITEVDTNNIVYNFAVSGSGITSHSFDNSSEYTVFNMQKSLTTMGIDSGSNLQIFIEKDYTEITFDETFVDPVSKIRVSQPENLIDTDFEYGLQGTKWETVELSNNVPSYYISDADSGVSDIVQITSKEGSDVITVQTVDAHRLVQGTPIDVRGLSSQTAEGKYIIQSVVNETAFTYKSRATQGSTGRLDGTYTIITPGQFYAGSQIPYKATDGITTDEAVASTITVTTPSEHGFVSQSNFYLVNTTSPKILQVNAGSGVAADGEPTVDPTNTISKVLSADMSNAETKQMKGTYSFKFKASGVSVGSNKILWRNSNFRVNDCVLYCPPQEDAPIGGLNRFDQYYVSSVDDSGITLAATYNGTTIPLTSAGTYNHGNGSFHMVYEIYRVGRFYNNYWQYSYVRNHMTGVGSGWDLRNSAGTPYGLGATLPSHMVYFSPIGYNPPTQALDVQLYSSGRNGNCQMPEGTHANQANFMEDFTMYRGYSRQRYSSYNHTDGRTQISWSWSNRWGNYDYNGLQSRNLFLIFLNDDNEADTFYNEDHGLRDGSTVTLETTGSAIFKSNHSTSWISFAQSSSVADGNYSIEVPSKDRFRLIDPDTGDNFRIMNATGEYTLIADVDKPTANSFYSADHGLADGESVVYSTLAGGTTPTADTGRLDINSAINAGNTAVAWTVLSNSLTTWLEGNLPGHRDILMDGPDARNPIRSGVATGTTSWLNNYFYDGIYINTPVNGATNTANAAASYQWGDSVIDLGKDTNNANQGFSARGSKYDGNQTLGFFGFAAMASRVQPWSDTRIYTRPYSDSSGEAWGTWNRRSHADNFYTSGWYTIETSGGRVGHVAFELILHNEQWQGTRTANFNGSWNNSTSGQGYTYTNNTEGKYVKYHSIFLIENGTSFTTTTLYEMIDQLITDWKTNFANPALTSGGTYRTSVVNNNRFKLVDSDSNIPVDLTSFGIPSFQFTVGRNGAADGAYTVSSVPSDTTFTMRLPFKIQKRAIEFDASLVTASSDLIGVSNHKLISGLPMVYNPGGNVPIPGLISGSTYYTVVRDETLLGFGSSSLDGQIGTLVTLSNSGSGTHTLEIDAMNGQFPGEGDVTILSGSTRISGSDDTLFKRYFKIGDTFRIKDTSETPARLSDFTIAAIADDNNMTLSSVSPFNQNQTKYFIQTKMYARPDGTFLHRPFDGGVEITAGSAPFSQIVRQTRKYFRYQSGKGIQTSLAINFNPPVLFERLTSSGSVANGSTKYPHRLNVGDAIQISGTDDGAYNGNVSVTNVIDEFTFNYDLSGSAPQTSIPGGLAQFNVGSWEHSVIRAGMFDFQNGFFYEFDGVDLYAVRRSSTAQTSGTATVTYNSNLVQGLNTNFSGQLSEGEYIVIRGQSYKVVKIKSAGEMVIQPQYKGVSAAGVILTKTEDLRVKQSDWNNDTADGNGPSGFELDKTKIQMAYMDYSWYGAGKVRFGFKDRKGKVIYVHSFLHNNRLTEAYMRSGNLPARYEIFNTGTPSYVPSLFHWGTSVIMDGRFDKDDSYLFTASSKPLSFTNGQTLTATTNSNSSIFYVYDRNARVYNFYVRVPFAAADASKFSAGTKLFAPGTQLQGQEVTYAEFSGSNYFVNIFFGTSTRYWRTPSGGFSVPTGTAVQVGEGNTGGGVNLGTQTIPLVTIRLAPSVDSGLPGALGEREIINRMQLILNEIGMIITHDCEVQLLLNADLSSAAYENSNAPSLSELIKHDQGDTALGGAQIFQYRASGGQVDTDGVRGSNTSNQSLGAIIDLGNSILGGDNAFPNGPDTLTVAVKVVDTSAISATSPFQISSRITWSESQA